MLKVTGDRTQIDLPDGATMLRACELGGKEILRFHYLEQPNATGSTDGMHVMGNAHLEQQGAAACLGRQRELRK